ASTSSSRASPTRESSTSPSRPTQTACATWRFPTRMATRSRSPNRPTRASASRPKQESRDPSDFLLQLQGHRLGARVAAGRGVGDRDVELHLAGLVELALLLPRRLDQQLGLAGADRFADPGPARGGSVDAIARAGQLTGVGDVVDRDRRGAFLLVAGGCAKSEGVGWVQDGGEVGAHVGPRVEGS